MHPVVILVPVAALAFLPGLWAKRLLERHNAQEVEHFPKGRELARQILDEHGLARVRVECTDLGDHYDPVAKAVRLSRDKYDRRSLAAITATAHETAHALQDASHYPPFVWRSRLLSLARVTGQVGSVVLIAAPAAALIGRRDIPAGLVGGALFSMLATGVAVQLAALPTELDASFRHALPLLREQYVDARQAQDARDILLATSSTYVAASLLSVLNIWPWIGVPRRAVPLMSALPQQRAAPIAGQTPRHKVAVREPRAPRIASMPPGGFARGVRLVAKPLIRGWLRASYALRSALP